MLERIVRARRRSRKEPRFIIRAKSIRNVFDLLRHIGELCHDFTVWTDKQQVGASRSAQLKARMQVSQFIQTWVENVEAGSENDNRAVARNNRARGELPFPQRAQVVGEVVTADVRRFTAGSFHLNPIRGESIAAKGLGIRTANARPQTRRVIGEEFIDD